MPFRFSAFCALVGSLACLEAFASAVGVAEIDVIFPRINGTYAPTDKFPVIFAVQNVELAKLLQPYFDWFVSKVYNPEDEIDAIFGNSTLPPDPTPGHHTIDPTFANYSSAPYFLYGFLKINTEGTYRLFSYINWKICDESGDKVAILKNYTGLIVPFTIEKGAQGVDLVAATADDKTCSARGVAFNVTDRMYNVPPSQTRRIPQPSGTCVALFSASPTTDATPCRVRIDAAVVESIDAWYHQAICKTLGPPDYCSKESSAQQLVVAIFASVAIVLGAVGFLVV